MEGGWKNTALFKSMKPAIMVGVDPYILVEAEIG